MEKFDVFLSHNSRDKVTVRELARSLRSQGLSIWLDEDELVPGTPWQVALERAILESKSVAVLVGSEGLGPWEDVEMRAALSEAVKRGLPVIPVLLPRAPSRVDLPIFLKNFTWVDLRSGFSDEGLENLVWGITGKKPGHRAISSKDIESSRKYRPEHVQTKLEDVFKTVGLPRFTYVEPTIYSKFAHAMKMPGKHIVLEGPSGVGKTCLVFRVLEDLGKKKDEDYWYISARMEGVAQNVMQFVQSATDKNRKSIIILDDFHTLPRIAQNALADQLKSFSDAVFITTEVPKFCLIGIPTSATSLLYNADDLGPRISTFKLPPATNDQLSALISEGEKRLAVRLLNPNKIISESNGSFYLCQYICHDICFSGGVLETQMEEVPLRFSMEQIRKSLLGDLDNQYRMHVLKFCKHETDGYPLLILIVCLVRLKNSVAYLSEVLDKAGPFSARVENSRQTMAHLLETLDGEMGIARYVHYDDAIETFSIENPAFHYYLSHMSIADLVLSTGCKEADLINFLTKGEGYSERVPIPLVSSVEKKAKEAVRDLIFISYSHQDAEWMEKLVTMLMPLVGNNAISAWTDTQIKPGSLWKSEIESALTSARIAVLLVSPDFLASDFIAKHELPVLLENARLGNTSIFWIPVRHCLWNETEISKYQPALDPQKPLANLSVANREKVLVSICEKIKLAIKDD